MEKITQLLYRKKMIENSLSKSGKGADVYSELHDILVDELTNGKKLTKLQRARMEVEIIEVKLQAQNFINSFKESKREYNHYLIPEIETVIKEMDEVPEISFEDYEDEANKLAIREIYGVTTKKTRQC